MDELFKSICDRLAALKGDDNKPLLNWIDWDRNQIETPAKQYPVQFPCCLIDFPECAWEDVGRQVQLGLLTISFRFIFHVHEDINTTPLSPNRQAGLDSLKALNVFHKNLQGFEGTNFNKLTRIRSLWSRMENEIKICQMFYTTNFRDSNATTQYVSVNFPGMDIEKKTNV